MNLKDGKKRVVIEGVKPEIDCGRFPVKRTLNETVRVEADAFTDGHDAVVCLLQYRRVGEVGWADVYMEFLGNDRWRGEFKVDSLGRWQYRLLGWVDHFESWRRELARRQDPQDIALALQMGAELVLQGARRAKGVDAKALKVWAQKLTADQEWQARLKIALDPELASLMGRYPDKSNATEYGRKPEIVVDPPLARFSAWYEMFPRSCGEAGVHGTFADCERWLEHVAALGFDVLYLPPIHPIGRINRKGPNNALVAGPDDPGSPWAIGADEGGHKAIHPQLGTLKAFKSLVKRARELGIEVALDIAFQTAPDHPYVKEHPAWFRWRPDGRVQYAENPPKKYEDIYPFHFESDDWPALWKELKSIFTYWVEQGVRVFRVDNPHTKPFALWEYIITEVKQVYPDVLFLAEAFTRPRITHRLAKLGFSQSYNYFPWRNTKQELVEYLTELSQDESREYFRPNLWPNTPDILTETLQLGGRPAFVTRFVLAATLGASYGIYGPAYELMEHTPRHHGSEEYLDSEKYQLRHWDLNRHDSLKELIARVNRIRRAHPALQHDWRLRFHAVDNPELIAFSKTSEDLADVILVVVNLDVNYVQSGWLELPLKELALDPEQAFQVHDLLGGERYLWHGARNFVQLDPKAMPAHIFHVRRKVHTERDFDGYA